MMHPTHPATCVSTRALFSGYLDGAISGLEMQSVSQHMSQCFACTEEFEHWRGIQTVLSSLGNTRPPADLGLKLRLAISHESARRRSSWRDSFSLRWDNLLRPMLLQVSAGFAGAVVLIGSIIMLLGVVATPDAVLANDEPLGALTAPHYLYSVALPRPVLTSSDASIVVEARINEVGQVYDYSFVSGPQDATTRAQVMDQLMLQVFEPATVFGAPVRGRAIVTFAGVSVRG